MKAAVAGINFLSILKKGGEKIMKKAIIFVVAMAFLASVASVAFARTMAEEMSAVRDYLNVVDAKLATAKQNKNTTRVRLLHAEKAATLARWYKLKATMVTPTAPTPPAPVAPVAPAAPVVAQPTVKAGVFGWGINTSIAGQYINTGKGSISGSAGLLGNLVLNDFVGLGPMFGGTANTVKFKLGTGYYQGAGLKAVPIYAGGVINLPQWMGGQDSYLTGGLNYVVYGNGQTSGKIGGDVFFGLTVDLGLGLGKTGFEIGYSVVRSNTVTSKGISLSVSQPLAL
jgi:hypothetical protein